MRFRGLRELMMLGALVLGSAVFAAGAQAMFLESVSGNVNQVSDLLRFDAIDSTAGLQLLGVYDDSEQTAGFFFPDGSPLGDLSGTVQFAGATPLYYTVKASKVTGLYSWEPGGDNLFDTRDFTKGRGFSAVRVWGPGGNGPAVPEPTAALVFALGAGVVGAALRRRAR
jgi:hypothetical protein